MQNKIKFLDEANISFKIENSMLEVYDQYDELIGAQPLPIPYEENMSGDEIYQKAEECGYDIDDMISDIVKKAVEDTKQYDFWLSDDVVIFYSPSKQCCTSEPYEGVFAKLREMYTEEKKNFELGADNVETENLDCPIEDNEETLEEQEPVSAPLPTLKKTEEVKEEVVQEDETPVEPVVEESKPVSTPVPKQNPQNNQPKHEDKKPQNEQKQNKPQPKQNPQNNQSKHEDKKPQNEQKQNTPQPKQNPQNNQQKPVEAPKTENKGDGEITFCITNDANKISEFKDAIKAIATYNSKNSDRKIGEVANMVVQLIESKGINPSNANEKDLVYDLALNNVTIIEGLSPVRAGIYKAMLLKELKNLGF